MAEIIIDDGNWQQFADDVPAGQMKGLIPRPYSAHPVGSYQGSEKFTMPLIPRSEWKGLIAEQEATKSRLSDIRETGMNGSRIQSRDQNGRGYCFPAGTLIRMADGSQKPIEQIGLLNRVLTAEGDVSRVMQCHVREHSGEIVTVKAWGHGHLRLTPNHSVFTKRGYVPAGELTVDDWIGLPRYSPQDSTVIQTDDHVLGVKRRLARVNGQESWEVRKPADGDAGHNEIPDFIHQTPGVGRILGLWLAEGFISGRSVIWAFNVTETDTLAAELVDLIRQEWGTEARVKPGPGPNVTLVVLGGILWTQLFKSLCGIKAGGKRIHADVMSGPHKFLEALFWGWMDGDGCRRVTGKRADYHIGATISHHLAINLFDIANALGLSPSINRERPQKNQYARKRQPVWKIKVIPEPSNYRPNYRVEVDTSRMWRKVYAVDRESYTGTVYNIGVEGDNSYVAEGVAVHNCWIHSGCSALLLLRARDHMPFVDLSAYMGACIIKNYRDEGGWGAQGLDWIREHGLPDSKYWPQKSVSRSNDTPEMRANARLHRVTEGWMDLDEPQYDRNLTFEQLATCLLNRIPVIVDFNWWGHSVCAVDLVSENSIRIWNSWGDGWSENGMGILTGSRAIPDGATAPRVATASIE